jgi:hypothetical protein
MLAENRLGAKISACSASPRNASRDVSAPVPALIAAEEPALRPRGAAPRAALNLKAQQGLETIPP